MGKEFFSAKRIPAIWEKSLGYQSVKKKRKKSARAQLSSYASHLPQKRCLQAACAELVHPQRSLVLQRGAAGVERVVEVIVQQTAEGGHVDV